MSFITDTLLPLAAIISMVVTVVVSIRKPNENQDVRLTKVETNFCNYEKSIEEIKKATQDNAKVLQLFKENEFRHLEANMSNLEKEVSVKFENIITILRERLPKKDNGLNN